eukprot:3745497-Pleurochrysis_carterae.AAC.1
MRKLDKLTLILHESQRHNPKSTYEARKAELTEKRQELIKSLSTPKPLPSYFKTLGGETTSTEFWRRVFPITKGRKGIVKLNCVHDWNHPPPKDSILSTYTQEIANEAAKYYIHLYAPQQENQQTKQAKHTLLQALRKWGVEQTTSDEAGSPIGEAD